MASSLMNNDEQYRQAALDLTAGPDGPAPARAVSPRRQSSRPRNQFHTLMPANRRLHDDLWQEYRLECAVREREGLPSVGLPEFAARRDWADRVDEPQDVAWPAVADDGSEEQRHRAMETERAVGIEDSKIRIPAWKEAIRWAMTASGCAHGSSRKNRDSAKRTPSAPPSSD